jgi:hypothetical protein
MKLVVLVKASEQVARPYTIEVGAGNQYISWLAQTACLLFGKSHYPSGIYVPSLLINDKDEDDPVPHPR